MSESSSSLHSPRAATQSNEQGLEFSKSFHEHFTSLLLLVLALLGSVVKFGETMLIAIGGVSILYFGAHLWIIQRTVGWSSRHLISNCMIVLLASVIFGLLIYSNVESPIKWVAIGVFPCVVPATNPKVLQLVSESSSKILKHLVKVASWAFERSHYKLGPWIARGTMSSDDREVSVNQEVGHDEINSGDDAQDEYVPNGSLEDTKTR